MLVAVYEAGRDDTAVAGRFDRVDAFDHLLEQGGDARLRQMGTEAIVLCPAEAEMSVGGAADIDCLLYTSDAADE